MARLRYRWLLPLGHLLVDVIVLSHIIGYAYSVLRQDPHPCLPPHVPLSQISWCNPLPPDFKLLVFATPPAGWIALALRPDASIQTCWHLWDPAWFAIHESVALLFWFLVGAWQDSPTARSRKLLGVYLGLRFALSPLCWFNGLALVAAAVEGVFWIVVCCRALDRGCSWLLRLLRARH